VRKNKDQGSTFLLEIGKEQYEKLEKLFGGDNDGLQKLLAMQKEAGCSARAEVATAPICNIAAGSQNDVLSDLTETIDICKQSVEEPSVGTEDIVCLTDIRDGRKRSVEEASVSTEDILRRVKANKSIKFSLDKQRLSILRKEARDKVKADYYKFFKFAGGGLPEIIAVKLYREGRLQIPAEWIKKDYLRIAAEACQTAFATLRHNSITLTRKNYMGKRRLDEEICYIQS